jgi:hypothetical protein
VVSRSRLWGCLVVKLRKAVVGYAHMRRLYDEGSEFGASRFVVRGVKLELRCADAR